MCDIKRTDTRSCQSGGRAATLVRDSGIPYAATGTRASYQLSGEKNGLFKHLQVIYNLQIHCGTRKPCKFLFGVRHSRPTYIKYAGPEEACWMACPFKLTRTLHRKILRLYESVILPSQFAVNILYVCAHKMHRAEHKSVRALCTIASIEWALLQTPTTMR